MHIGQKIRVARAIKQMTQEDLASRIGKTRPLISQIESTGKVKMSTLKEISKILDIDLNDVDFTSFFEDNEYYGNNKKNSGSVKTRAELEKEIQTLRDLVQTQKELIEQLRKKVK